MDIRETYNRIAEDWHNSHIGDAERVDEVNRFLSFLPEAGSVLDVGCGSGIKSVHMLERGFRVTGVDISENLLAIAKREAPQGDFRVMSMTELDSMNEEFDGVFAQASLLHIPKNMAADVVRRMAGRVRPGGYLYIAVKGLSEGNAEEELKREHNYGYEYERFFSYYRPEELAKYVEEAGLSVVSNTADTSGNTVWLHIVGYKQPLA